MVDTSPRPDRSHLDVAVALLDGGARVLQLRMKGAPAHEQANLLQAILPLCQDRGASLIVNDHLDLAVAHPGVGLHLGQDDTSPLEARRTLGPGPLIGLSTHSPDQARSAAMWGVDYIGFGPVFSADSKHLGPGDHRAARPPVGLAALNEVVRDATVSVVAIGGISHGNLPLVLATGVAAIAVISAVVAADDMVEAASALHRSIEVALSDPPPLPREAPAR